MMNAFDKSGVTVFDPGPELTMENAHELLKLLRAISSSRSPNIVVNLQQTQVLDSTGIGALLSSMRYVRQLKGGFALSNLSPELERMFSLMNLHQSMEIFDTVDVATDHLTHRIKP